jgi:hypothetical protein
MRHSIRDQLVKLNTEINSLKEKFSEVGYSTKTFVQSEIKSHNAVPAQDEIMMGIHTAFCIDTIDPWKQNRVRFFSPLMHKPDATIKQLPFAYPISPMGGFDECGLTWVPPAGSKLVLIFEDGNRQAPYYLGTTWDRYRGPDGKHVWGYNIDEYYKLHEGHRRGYYIGSNDGSEVLPPWNTENYNNPDIDDKKFRGNDPTIFDDITYPNIYGFKTPQKHMCKMVDGDYRCNQKGSRIELKSGGGNILLFKDDHLHPAGQWLNPSCSCGSGFDASRCNETGVPQGQELACANPYHKHSSECRPYGGPGTQQNNKIELEQTGFQLMSQSGHTFYACDKVKNPKNIPDNWERGTESFDYGDYFEGQMKIITANGHSITLNDLETEENVRAEDNGIKIETASGLKIIMSDHTRTCPPNGPPLAGEGRGIHMYSTAGNEFHMSDVDNQQCQERKEGGEISKTATQAFIQARTGYGLEFMMADYNSQTSCDKQFIQLRSPQTGACCGPHIIRMQEDPNCGQIFVRAGGDYICSTEGDHYTIIGGPPVEKNQGDSSQEDFCEGGCLGPKSKITIVSQHTLHKSCNFYYNVADIHAFFADRYILLMAGKDCQGEGEGDECGPCLWPVLVAQQNRIVASDRVFASASGKAQVASIFQMMPFVNSDPIDTGNC